MGSALIASCNRDTRAHTHTYTRTLTLEAPLTSINHNVLRTSVPRFSHGCVAVLNLSISGPGSSAMSHGPFPPGDAYRAVGIGECASPKRVPALSRLMLRVPIATSRPHSGHYRLCRSSSVSEIRHSLGTAELAVDTVKSTTRWPWRKLLQCLRSHPAMASRPHVV
jgi:hypothetical protein